MGWAINLKISCTRLVLEGGETWPQSRDGQRAPHREHQNVAKSSRRKMKSNGNGENGRGVVE